MTTLNEIRKNAVETLQSGKVVDQYKWNVFCTMLKMFPCSDEFSTDDLFQLMTQCCDMCQKDEEHHHHEFGSCCKQCAREREDAEDVIPFIMKNYYHAHKRQYDDATDIWFAHDETPIVYNYEVVNESLPQEINFYDLCKSTCACCENVLPCESKFSYIV
jgi:hypothetical protein